MLALGRAGGGARPGFEILGGPSDGTYAELVAVPPRTSSRSRDSFSWEEAAAFPLAGLTAYRALFSRAGLQPGETVLVLGAGSGVSTIAVSLAHQAGARVLVTSSSAEKIERAKELGRGGRRRLHGRRLGRRGARARGGRGRRRRRGLRRIDVARLAALPSTGRAARGLRRHRRGDGRARGAVRSTSASSRSSARRWGARRISRRSCGRSTRGTGRR